MARSERAWTKVVFCGRKRIRAVRHMPACTLATGNERLSSGPLEPDPTGGTAGSYTAGSPSTSLWDSVLKAGAMGLNKAGNTPPQVIGWLTGRGNGTPPTETTTVEDKENDDRAACATSSPLSSAPATPITTPAGHAQDGDPGKGIGSELLAPLPRVDSTPQTANALHTPSALRPSTTTPPLLTKEMSLPWSEPSTLEQGALAAARPSHLQICFECENHITGPVFMLHDLSYCCQRHRLAAYNRNSKTPTTSRSSEPSREPMGLNSIYMAWM